MKILVTGATGFIGSHLVPYLKNHDVAVLDAHLVNKSSTAWHPQVDSCDVLVHLAGRAHISSKNSDAQIYKSINTDLTEILAQRLALKNKHMVFISTAVIYGEKSKLVRPFRVTDLLHSDSPYSASKVAGEIALQKISKQSEFSFTIIRPPLVYGPRVKANFLAMIKWVQSGVPLPLGGARNLRSLVGVRNLVDLIENCAINPAAKNQVFNVSDDQDISTTDLLKIIAQSMNKQARLVKIPLSVLKLGGQIIGKPRAYDGLCSSFQLDITNTKEKLNWTPPFSLRDEIEATTAWFQSEYK